MDQYRKGTPINQRNAIKRYVSEHPEMNINIKEWFEDKGKSGAMRDRPELMGMLDNLDEVEGIIAYDISRLSRDIKAWSLIMFQLRDAKKKLLLVKDGRLDDYAVDKTRILTGFIEGYVADDERENTIKRIKEGIHRYKEKYGRWGRYPPKINWKRVEHYRNDFKPAMPFTIIAQMPDVSDRGPVSRSYFYDALNRDGRGDLKAKSNQRN